MKRISTLLTAMLFTLTLVGCSAPEAQNKPLQIAVSIPPISAFVSAVARDRATVQVLIPPGYSPETYSPAPKDLVLAQEASLFFGIGVPAEKDAILPHLNEATRKVALEKSSDAVYPPRTIGNERDPHCWLSPKRAIAMIQEIILVLSEADPAYASVYAQNGATYIQELAALDADLRDTLAPIKNRAMVVFHPAFGYFADDYGLAMYALEEEGKEATPQHLQEMAELARIEGTPVIFHQAEIDSRQAEAFAREIGGQTVALDPLSADYIENLRRMATTIKEALSR